MLGPVRARGRPPSSGCSTPPSAPTSGRFCFEGRDVSALTRRELRAVRRRIGTVFQQPRLVPSLTARQNALTGRVGHWSSLEARAGWRSVPRGRTCAGPTRRWRQWDSSDRRPAPGPTSSPAASSSGWPSPGCWCRSRRWCWPTSRWPRSTRRCAASIGELLLGAAARAGTLVAVLHDVDFARPSLSRASSGWRAGRVAFDLPTERGDARPAGAALRPRRVASRPEAGCDRPEQLAAMRSPARSR